MTREEAIKQIESLFEHCEAMMTSDEPVWSQDCEALKVALFALRGPTREQVEKAWRGEWEEERFAGELEGWQHRECGRHSTEKSMWCPKCGKAMIDKAVDMVMERMEALHSETKTD